MTITDRTSLCHDAWRFHTLADALDQDVTANDGEITSAAEWMAQLLREDATTLVDRLCAYQSELDARDEVCRAEIDRLRRVLDTTECRRKWSRGQLGQILDSLGVRKIETATRMVLRTNGTKRAEPDASGVPEIDFSDPRFIREIPAKLEWDKPAIAKALKGGEDVPGWHLALGEKGVQIR